MTRKPTDALTRRHVLGGAAAVGLGGPVLAACGATSGSNDAGSESASGSDASGPTIICTCHGSTFSAVDGAVLGGPASSGLASEAISVKGQDIAVDGQVVGSTSDIPEGGGTVFPDQKVVVTQPGKGDFKAFSAVCTHQGCLVKSVQPG
jgi:nitrite reductase/ring-hydroxylating ferredoxin subunit